MITKNTFCFLSVINLFFIITYIYASEKDEDHYDYGEKLVLIYSDDLNVDENKNQYNDEVQEKINFLKKMGYSQVKNVPDFFFGEIYRMIYGSDIGKNEGSKSTIFYKDGIGYILTYSRYKPNDPNFYVSVYLEVGSERHWFLKINYFLEYSRIEEWLNIGTGVISVEKLFF